MFFWKSDSFNEKKNEIYRSLMVECRVALMVVEKLQFHGQDFALMGIIFCHFLRLKCFGVQKNSFSQSLQPSLRG